MVLSSAMPSMTMRLPGSRMPWPCSELTRMVSAAQQPGEGAARGEVHVVAVAEDHLEVRMGLPGLGPRHAVVDAAGQFTDFRVQRAAERHAHLLKAAADAEQRHAALDAGLTRASASASRRVS